MSLLQRVKSLLKGNPKKNVKKAEKAVVPPRAAPVKKGEEKSARGNRSRKGPRFEKGKSRRSGQGETWRAGGKKPQPAADDHRAPRKAARPDRRAEHEAWDAASYQVPEMADRVRFVDLDLPSELQHALCDLNFRYCTPIQEKSLPKTLAGRDLCGRAQTGTGKTAAFLLSVFTHLLRNEPVKERRKGLPRALIMAPTRELCMQIAGDGEALGAFTGLNILALYGGMDMTAQRQALRGHPVDVVVATPGRLLDFRQQQEIDFSGVEVLVIDEADRMLDMGFIPDMRRIVFGCPPKQKRQTLLFSATLEPAVTRLAEQWMNDPVTVNIEPERVAAETIDQRVYIVTGDQKFTIVYNILQKMKPERTIIFGNRRDSTEALCDNLRHQGIDVSLLSGAVDQRRRVKVLEDFKSGRVPVLVATDVAGRGLHIDGVDLIINFNIPEQAEDYVHRIGRTGRVGESGTSVTFADELDSYYIPAVEEYMKQPLRCVPPPEEWLEPLPKPMLEKKRRERREGGFGGRPGGRPGGRSGGRRPPSRGARR